jgi:hypothetical protein
MATETNIGADTTIPASADLSTKQFFFVSLNSSGQIQVAGANVSVVGVLQDKPAAAGRGGQVRYLGITKVLAAGTIAANDKIASDGSGKAVKATAGSVSAGTPEPLAGSYVVGIALAAASSGDYVSVLLTHAGITN